MTRSLARPVAHVCRVCGRPSQVDDLCGRHGGSAGLIVQTEGLPRSLRIGLRSMVTGAVLTMVLGALAVLLGASLTGRVDSPSATKLAGLVMLAVGLVMLFLAMWLSQLRRWAGPVSVVACAVAGLAGAVMLVLTRPASSFATLLVVCTIGPFLLAAGLEALWWVREASADREAAAQAAATARG